MSYVLRGDGAIEIDHRLTPASADLPKIPRVGTQLVLPAALRFVTWFVRGPHESYADRLTSARVGRWAAPVSELVHRYPRPQETGNRTGVRWMAVTDEHGVGLLAVGRPRLSASLWPFAMDDLDYVPGERGAASASGLVPVTSRHGADLVERDFVTWNLDFRQMGVGGDTSWGRPVHEEYTIAPQELSYRFCLVPFDEDESDPGQLARTSCLGPLKGLFRPQGDTPPQAVGMPERLQRHPLRRTWLIGILISAKPKSTAHPLSGSR